MTTRVSFPGKSGAELFAEVAEPRGTDESPAVILLQEYWGLNEHIKEVADRMALEGFFVVAPDLYHGVVTKDPAEASRLATELDTLKAVEEIGAAVAFAAAHDRSSGKVGVMGFCLGGALALASACHVPGLSAVVAFYGIPPAEKVDYTKATAPIMTHVATKDRWVTPEKMEGVRKALAGRGHPIEVHLYDADHGFANDTRPVYDAASATLAWQRTVAFFRRHLA